MLVICKFDHLNTKNFLLNIRFSFWKFKNYGRKNKHWFHFCTCTIACYELYSISSIFWPFFYYFLFISIFEREKFLPIKIFHKMHTFSYLSFGKKWSVAKYPLYVPFSAYPLVELIFQWKNNVLRRNTACQNVYWQHFKIPRVAIHNSGNFPTKLPLGTHLDFSPKKKNHLKKF